MAKAKKASSKSKLDIKQFMLEKGEKIGLILGGIGLVVLALMGIMAATKAASPGELSKGLKNGTQTIDTRLAQTPDIKPPERKVPAGDSTAFRTVKVNEFVTPYPLFNPAGLINEKRVNPQALAAEAGQAVYAIGGVGVYVIQGDMIAVIEGRKRAQNDMNGIPNRFKKGGMPTNLITQPPASAPQPTPAPTPPPGGAMGSQSKGAGGGGAPKGGAGGVNRPPDEKEVAFKAIDSKDIDSAVLAIDLRPERMAVVRAVVPYKKQVEKYLRALRIDTDAALATDKSAPIYRGFDVQRLVLEADGKTVREDWRDFDFSTAYRELYRLTAKFEEEEERFKPFKPESLHQLYLARPAFVHGGYSIPVLPQLVAALEEMKQTGPKVDLTPRQDKLKGGGNIFDDPAAAAPPVAGGAMPPPAAALQPPQQGLGKMSGAGAASVARNNTMPVWIMQFVDPTIEPGLCYKYRVRLKLQNPNYNRKNDVANPGLAEVLELTSEWFEIPDIVHAPPEEHLYAGGEKHYEAYFGSGADKTSLKFHRWVPYNRTKNSTAQDPIAEWVIADIDAFRGQIVHQEKKVMMPLWMMTAGTNGAYMFKQKVMVGGRPSNRMENVDADFTPTIPTLLVDFQGGKGPYRLPTGTTVSDDCSAEVLLITNDGRTVSVHSRSTSKDKENAEKKAREDNWIAWLREVAQSTPRQ